MNVPSGEQTFASGIRALVSNQNLLFFRRATSARHKIRFDVMEADRAQVDSCFIVKGVVSTPYKIDFFQPCRHLTAAFIGVKFLVPTQW